MNKSEISQKSLDILYQRIEDLEMCEKMLLKEIQELTSARDYWKEKTEHLERVLFDRNQQHY